MNNLMKTLTWSQGNPGAMMFLTQLFDHPDAIQLRVMASKLERCKSIRGTSLYVLYAYLCNKDIDKVHSLCLNCPDNVLEDACSRQDYSGRELILDYL